MIKIDLNVELPKSLEGLLLDLNSISALRFPNSKNAKVKKNLLKPTVISALTKYQGSSIEDAVKMYNLAERLSKEEVVELSEEQIKLIEDALSNEKASIKATWRNMINSLNREDLL